MSEETERHHYFGGTVEFFGQKNKALKFSGEIIRVVLGFDKQGRPELIVDGKSIDGNQVKVTIGPNENDFKLSGTP